MKRTAVLAILTAAILTGPAATAPTPSPSPVPTPSCIMTLTPEQVIPVPMPTGPPVGPCYSGQTFQLHTAPPFTKIIFFNQDITADPGILEWNGPRTLEYSVDGVHWHRFRHMRLRRVKP